MEIWAIYDEEGQISVSPEHAKVRVGTNVVWRFQSNIQQSHGLIWTVYFRNETPFLDVSSISAMSFSDDNNQHTAASDGEEASVPGRDYKYGIKLVDEKSGKELADEDPYIDVILKFTI